MSDPYADRTHDDAGEPLCTAASAALHQEYSTDLPPDQPETT